MSLSILLKKRSFQAEALSECLGWCLAIIVPMVMYGMISMSQLNWASINFIVIFSAALVMWVFRLVPEYAPAVFVILATVLLGVAPQSVLLSGFSSSSFFLALSVFGIGAVLIKSNVFYRLALTMLHHLPQRVICLQVMVFFIGVFLTPVMTAQSGRVSLVAPLLDDIQKGANLPRMGPVMNSLASCAFHGAILLSVVFLTGKSSNFILYGMLSTTMQAQYNWLHWLLVSAFPALLLIISFFVVSHFQWTPRKTFHLEKEKIKQQLEQLGGLGRDEWAAIIAVSALLLGLLTSSLHQIPSAWLAFAIFFFLLMTGVLNKQDFKTGINWPFLFYLGAIIGIMRCVNAIGIDLWLAEQLSFMATIADQQPYVFILLIYGLGWLGSLIFGTAAAPALLFTILLPMATHALINTWLIAFVLLMATESWLFPYQSSYFLCFEDLAKTSKRYKLQSLLRVNASFCLVRVLVIMASMPVWHALELI